MKKCKCDICGRELSKEQIKIEQSLGDNPCDCEQFELYFNKINKLKKRIKELNTEINYLNILLSDADDSSWDAKLIYEDALNGNFNGNKIEGGKPDKKFAKWIAQRYNLDWEDINR